MSNEIQRIAEEKKRWAAASKLDESPKIETDLGIEVDALYTPADIESLDYLRDLGFPGEYPFTRGIRPQMHRQRPWRLVPPAFSGFGSAEDTNARWKLFLKMGAMGFSLAPDLPTHLGLDSDDSLAEDEVGRVGMAVDTLRDFEILFDGLPIESRALNCNEEGLAAIIVAFYIALGEKRGIPASELAGSISNDVLTAAAAKGTVVLPLEPAVRLCVDLIEYCTKNMPRFFPVQLKGIVLREVRANMAQEMGFTFASALCYIQEALKRGHEINDVARRFSWFCGASHHIFEEAAKFRAARRLWAKLLKERFGATDPAAMSFRFLGATSPAEFQVEEPLLNLVRGACGVIACILGGAQTAGMPGYDEAYEIPSELSARLSAGTCQIIAEETNITKTVDPLGGSYFVEHLTNRMEEEIAKKLKEIEDYGGPIKAIADGYMQRDLLNNFYKECDEIASGERVIVRKTKYRLEEEEREPVLHKPNPEAVRRQIERLREVRAERNNAEVKERLRRLREAAESDENLMPYLIEAAKAYATIGEMAGTLKEVFGEYKETIVV